MLSLGGPTFKERKKSYFLLSCRNKYEVPLQMDSPVGLYNIPQQRTSQAFSSMDDLDAMVVAQKQLSGKSLICIYIDY
jgi:hypothetical protein